MTLPAANARLCEVCQNAIDGDFTMALEGLCHIECLICSQCELEIKDPQKARVDQKNIKCLACFSESNDIEPCNFCGRPISDAPEVPINSGGKIFHVDCFKCKSCEQLLSPGWNYKCRDHLFCGTECIQRFDETAIEVVRPAPRGFGRAKEAPKADEDGDDGDPIRAEQLPSAETNLR